MTVGHQGDARRAPVRETMLPYGRQTVDETDIAAVAGVLRSDWLTTGPAVERFENAFAEAMGAGHAVAVSSGTAALHAAVHAIGIGPGDEVVVPPLTFAATANAVVYEGGTPVFADVDPETLLIDPDRVEAKVSERTKAVICVDYAGQPCDYGALRAIVEAHGLGLIADACHAMGGSFYGAHVGSLAGLSAFSLHPVKHITAGEGGVVTTDDESIARAMRVFRNHGITTDHRARAEAGSWSYEMVELGYNYRLSDIQCALAESQLARLPAFVARRREIAARYDEAFAEVPGIDPVIVRPDVVHAYHLYPVLLDLDVLGVPRGEIFSALRNEGIGVNVHYIPVHLHPFYRERFGTKSGDCPVAEAAYERLLSLPIFPAMTDDDASDVVKAVERVVERCRGSRPV